MADGGHLEKKLHDGDFFDFNVFIVASLNKNKFYLGWFMFFN